MKYKEIFLLIIFGVFCTERLQKIFYIGFFDLYPARALFLTLIPFFNFKEFLSYSSKEVKFIFKILFFYILFVLISALNSQDVFYSFKKWLDILTINFFIFLIYAFLIKACQNIRVIKLQNIFLSYFKYVIIICCIGSLFLVRQIDDGGNNRIIAGLLISRRISLFTDANFFCTFLACSFSFIYFIKTKNKFFYLTIIFLSILLSGSKGGMISLAITFIFYFRNKIIFLKSKLFPLLGISILVVLISSAVFKPKETIDKITSLSFFSEARGDGTILPRIISWSSGFKKFAESPFTGIGPGNIVNINKGSKNSNLLTYLENAGFYGFGDDSIDKLATHSNYLEILFEHGIIAFALYLIFIYKILQLSWSAISLNKSIFVSFYMLFCAFFLSTILLSYYPYYMSFFFGIFLFMYDKINKQKMYDKVKFDEYQKH